MMRLNRQEKEKLVLDLYSQGRTYREIAEEARICPRDIKAIVEKPVKATELKQSISVSSQAYKLFSEGKPPLEVAIELNIRDAEVTELYKEYWNLKNLHDLSQVYEEIKDDIYSFAKLYKLAKEVGMNAQHVVNLLTIANNYLPAVEQRYEKLKREEASLQAGNHNSARILQELSDLISTTRDNLERYELSCKERRLEIKKQCKEYTALEGLVNDFQNNNEEYVKIIKVVEEKVVSILSNVKVLLRCALLSITKSIRNNPERFRSLFYNMPSIIDCYNTNGQDYAASYTHIGQIQQYYLSPDYNADADISIIADEAEKLYNTVVKDSINKIIIVDYPFRKSSSLPLLPASTEEQQKSYELESNSTT